MAPVHIRRLDFALLVVLASLLGGEADPAVGRHFALPSTVVADPSWQDGCAVAARPGHPGPAVSPGLDALRAARHVVAPLDGGLGGVVGRALQAIGRRREVVAAHGLLTDVLPGVTAEASG